MDDNRARFLVNLYFLVEKKSGWLFKAERVFGLTPEDVRYLEELDDAFTPGNVSHDEEISRHAVEIRAGLYGAESDDVKLKIINQKLMLAYSVYEELVLNDVDFVTREAILHLKDIPHLEKLKDGLVRKLWHKNNPDKTRITDQDIERARNYPMEKLVDIDKNGRVKCFAHADKNPSGWVKNNFFWCFSCMEWADSIKLLMKQRNIGFVEAVKWLIQ